MRKYLLLLLIFCCCLQSCFYIIGGKYWKGSASKNEKEYGDTSNYRLSVYMGLAKQSRQITIPFFFIEKDKKGPYRIGFTFITSDIHYKEIDSLSFQINDDKESLVLKGSIKDSGQKGEFKYLKIYKDSAFIAQETLSEENRIRLLELVNSKKKHPEYHARLETGYIIRLPYKRKKDLKINFTLYVTTDTNQKNKLKYVDCILLKSPKTKIDFMPISIVEL